VPSVTQPSADTRADLVVAAARSPRPVTVLRVEELAGLRRPPPGSRIVVDATRAQDSYLPALATAVRWRRRLRASGGTLVIAADDAVTAALTRTGLRWVLPHRRTVEEASAAAATEA
jgi:hypothetical protein